MFYQAKNGPTGGGPPAKVLLGVLHLVDNAMNTTNVLDSVHRTPIRLRLSPLVRELAKKLRATEYNRQYVRQWELSKGVTLKDDARASLFPKGAYPKKATQQVVKAITPFMDKGPSEQVVRAVLREHGCSVRRLSNGDFSIRLIPSQAPDYFGSRGKL